MKQVRWFSNLYDYIKLGEDVDDLDKIHNEIEQDLVFRGPKLWILVLAIIVACVGLNMNSSAVIIGAMLISPLMGPINGLGYGIATYDFLLFKKALKNFLFAIITGLIASTIYFSISPIDVAYSEIIQRTSPSIYDVIIAFFGGLAGMIAISSRHKGNVIPGVAIATALIPPLCTAGYGIATAQFTYFFGALYLFTINSVFIAFSALIISQLLKFPIRSKIDDFQKKKINRFIYITIFLVLIPSIYFGYQLVQKEKFFENASRFVQDIRTVEGNYLLKNEILPATKEIILTYGGTNLSESEKLKIRNRSEKFELKDAEITFRQGLSFGEISQKKEEVDYLKNEMTRLGYLFISKDKQIDSLQKRKYIGKEILKEIKTLYPQITSVSFSDSYLFSDSLVKPEKIDIVVIRLKENKLEKVEEEKIYNWLKISMKSSKMSVYYE